LFSILIFATLKQESWPSGRRRTPGKCVGSKRASRVRIPHSPPLRHDDLWSLSFSRLASFLFDPKRFRVRGPLASPALTLNPEEPEVMNYIHRYYPSYQYFAHQLGDISWRDFEVLDFGGNWGNLLRDPKSAIEHDKYTCIDVDSAPIKRGSQDFPKAKWLRYDRFNSVYNHGGKILSPLPALDQQFDIITAFSVFTHTSKKEMQHTVYNELLPLLKPTGKLLMTFLHPAMLKHFVNKRFKGNPAIRCEQILDSARGLSEFFYIDDDVIQTQDPGLDLRVRALLSFYTEEALRATFPDLSLQIRPPALSEIQHCAIFSARSAG